MREIRLQLDLEKKKNFQKEFDELFIFVKPPDFFVTLYKPLFDSYIWLATVIITLYKRKLIRPNYAGRIRIYHRPPIAIPCACRFLELRSPTKKKMLNLKNKVINARKWRKNDESTTHSFEEPAWLSKNRNIVFVCLNLVLCLTILIAAIFYLEFYKEFQILKSKLLSSDIWINQQLESSENSALFVEKDQDRWNLISVADISKLRQIMSEQTLKIEKLAKTNVELWLRQQLSSQ